MVRIIPHTEKLFIGGDFYGHIGASARGYDDVHGGFGFRDRNEGGNSLLDFARAFDLVIANLGFPKREKHLVTFGNSMGKTQIDYLLCRKYDKGLCTDYKVIPTDREVLGVTKGSTGGHKKDWWWNEEVQGKVEAKKDSYLKLVESTNEKEKRTYQECYRNAKKEAKLAITTAKNARLLVCTRSSGAKAGTRSCTGWPRLVSLLKAEAFGLGSSLDQSLEKQNPSAS
uniref:Craniofacial development protein 2-like n=1 Tax=Nicotiana tabacum TaxID=4097 RepID=A0A1S4CDL8_TOBAC